MPPCALLFTPISILALKPFQRVIFIYFLGIEKIRVAPNLSLSTLQLFCIMGWLPYVKGLLAKGDSFWALMATGKEKLWPFCPPPLFSSNPPPFA